MSVVPLNLLDLFGSGNLTDVKFLVVSNVTVDTSTTRACIPGGSYPTGLASYSVPDDMPYQTHHSVAYSTYESVAYPTYNSVAYTTQSSKASPTYESNGYTTVYTTEYVQVCPTEKPCPEGTNTETYTITETCTGAEAEYTRPTIPPHFTTAVTVCHACEGEPTLTLTCPTPEETAKGGANQYSSIIEANPSGTAVNPGGIETNPSGTAVNPGGVETNPSGTAVNPGGIETNPSGTAVNPGGIETNPSGTAVNPGGIEANPSGTTANPSTILQTSIACRNKAAVVVSLFASTVGLVALFL